MDGYSNSRGTLLSRGRASPLSLVMMSALALAACGGGGGGGDDDGGGTPPPVVNPPPANTAPTAAAGDDKTAAYPEPVSLTGTASDAENNALTYAWSGTGPGTVTFSAATALATTATFSAPGTYTLTLAVNDGTNTTSDTVSVVTTPLYPTTTWTAATPAEVGLDPADLDTARTYSEDVTPNGFSGGSGVVIRYGKLVYSWGDQSATTGRYDVKSATKSIGGLALLFALAENKLTLQTTGQALLGTDFAASPAANQTLHSDWVSTINVQQLATHTAGFEKTDDPGAPSEDGELLTAPGATWRYSDAGLNWLADVLTKSYQADLYTVLKTKVFDPLGISSVAGSSGAGAIRWRDNQSRDPTLPGTTIPRRELAAGMFANVDALARVGYLMLRKGAWNGTQLLPENIVALAHQPPLDPNTVPIADPAGFPEATKNYGLLWWTNAGASALLPGVPTDAYWAWGLGESLIVVIPSLDMVIARAATPDQSNPPTGRQWNYGWDGDYDVLAGFLVPLVQAAAP